VPVTSALPGISKHYTAIQTVVIFNFFKLDPGSSQATVEDDTIMVSVPVPVTSALPGSSKHYTVFQTVVIFNCFKLDPGSSQAIVEDDTLIDSVPLPVTSTLPGISKHYTVSQTVVIFYVSSCYKFQTRNYSASKYKVISIKFLCFNLFSYFWLFHTILI
jgi:hypothetical protein